MSEFNSEIYSDVCCDICCENLTQYYMCPNCKTKNCAICFETYLNNYIDELNTSYDIQCPGCKRILNPDDIKNTCGSSFMDNFIKQLAINNISDLEIQYGHLISKFEKEKSSIITEMDDFKRVLYSLYYNDCKRNQSIIYETEVNKYRDHIDIEEKFNQLIQELIATKNDFEESNQCGYIMDEIVSEFISEIDNKYSRVTLEYLKELVLDTIKIYYPGDKILTPKQFKRLIKNTKLEIPAYKITDFIDKNIVNNEQYLKICRCDKCEYGIVHEMVNMKHYVCNSCESEYCKECLKLSDVNHECNEDDLENAKYLLKNTKPCPRCATRIEKNVGCDDMYCTYCKCGFSWTTGRYITRSFHNPHRMEDLDKGIRKGIELPDQICSDIYIFSREDSKIVKKFEYIMPNLSYLSELRRKFNQLIKYRSNQYCIKTKLFHLLDAKFNENYETTIDYFCGEYEHKQIKHDLNIIINIHDILTDFFIKLDQIILNETYIPINEYELIIEYNNLINFVYDLQLDLDYEFTKIIKNDYHDDLFCDDLFYSLKLIKYNSIKLPISINKVKYIDLCLSKEVTEDTIDSNFKWLSEQIKLTKNIDSPCDYIRRIINPYWTFNVENDGRRDMPYNTLIEKHLRKIPTYFNEKLKSHNVFIGLMLYVITDKDIDLENFKISATSELFNNLMKWICGVRYRCMDKYTHDYIKRELFQTIFN